MSEAYLTILPCPSCGQQLRVPAHRGDLILICPVCRYQWSWEAPRRDLTSTLGGKVGSKEVSIGSEVDVHRQLKDLGIFDLEQLSAADMKKLLDAYLKNKSLDHDAFQAIVAHFTPALPIVFDGLKAFANDQAPLAKHTLEIIQLAIGILEQELARDGVSPDERAQMRNRVFDLVMEARKETKENRDFLLKLATIGGGIAVLLVGVAVYALTGGKNDGVIKAGGEMLKKAI
jgi:hypothetical protein